MNRWSIYIDIEGFSEIYQSDRGRAIAALGELMSALFKVGSRAFANAPRRLFIHQFGDGFVVVSDFPEESPDQPIAICLAVMRHLISRMVATKAAISKGDFADFLGCYPSEVLEGRAVDSKSAIKLGDGLMTIIPVMGSALINPYKLHCKQSGAVLMLDASMAMNVPEGVRVASQPPLLIDWIHSDLPIAAEICRKGGLSEPKASETEDRLRKYIVENRSLPERWIKSTLDAVGLAAP